MVTLSILNWHPATLNQLMRGRRYAGKLKKRDRVRLITEARLAGLAPATTKRRVTLEVVMAKGQRTPDVDAYWKSLLDALVHAELLVSDHSKWVEIAPLIPRRSKDQTFRSIITLEDI